jgi:cytochrome c biogenesis protein CcdA/glutaredoxin
VSRLLLLAVLLAPVAGLAEAPGSVRMFVFWGQGCPHCEDQKPFLRGLEVRHPGLEVIRYEVWRDARHRTLFREMAAAHGHTASSVPTLFVGGQVWVGDGPDLRRQIEAKVAACLRAPCPDPAAGLPIETPSAVSGRSLTVPGLGAVDLRLQPLLLSTVLIALADGFNPCSLWVLTVLLGLVVHSGSRRRVLLVGLTFLATTTAVYGLFVAGVFGALAYVAYLGWVQVTVALFALGFALVNIKDYFWFQRGPSFTISERHKPRIYRRIRGLLAPERSPWALVTATFVMALGIALVELPCTAGFPVLWSALVAEHRPGILAFAGLLAVYLVLYLLIELIVVIAALLTLRIRRFEEGHGRVLKLVGGMIMLALALMLLLDPDRMNRVDGAFAVFVGAIAAALVVIVVHRGLLPRLGIRLGSGWRGE